MYALKEILNKINKTHGLIFSEYRQSEFPKVLKHYIEASLFEVDKQDYRYFKCAVHTKSDEDGRVKITVLPHNLYTLVYFSTGEKPNIFRLKGQHDKMNLEPIKYDDWTLYFDKNDQPIAINRNLGMSDKAVSKFNL